MTTYQKRNTLTEKMQGMTKHAIEREIPIFREAMPQFLEANISHIRIKKS